jgi:hypothetical protein
MAERIGGVFCCARIEGTAANSSSKAQSTARTLGVPWLHSAMWRKQARRSDRELELEMGMQNRRCVLVRVFISGPLVDLIIWVRRV